MVIYNLINAQDGGSQSMTLKECVDYAFEHNQDV